MLIINKLSTELWHKMCYSCPTYHRADHFIYGSTFFFFFFFWTAQKKTCLVYIYAEDNQLIKIWLSFSIFHLWFFIIFLVWFWGKKTASSIHECSITEWEILFHVFYTFFMLCHSRIWEQHVATGDQWPCW